MLGNVTLETSMRKKFILSFVLILVTVATIIWHHFGMEKTILVETGKADQIQSDTDRINGGKSLISYQVSNDKIEFECKTIANPYSFAYCGIQIPLTFSDKNAIDLTSYDTISFELDYKTTSPDTLLIYLTNKEIGSQGPIERHNMHAVNPIRGKQQVSLSLNNFSVPSWWIFSHSDVADNGLRNLENVIKIRIVSGDSTVERVVNVGVRNIVLKGKWIQSDQLYLSLLIFWIMAIVTDLLLSLDSTRKAYINKSKESSSLKKLNDFLAIERDKFETMAKRDPLTGCANRAGVRDFISFQLDKMTSKHYRCSLIVLDIDHFKDINDNHGHDIGDEVLEKIAKLLKSSLREQDMIARWGGEEFLVICPNTPKQGAVQLADNLRIAISESSFIDGKQITCSFGVSALKRGDFEKSFKQADAALYQAKLLGRNCVQS